MCLILYSGITENKKQLKKEKQQEALLNKYNYNVTETMHKIFKLLNLKQAIGPNKILVQHNLSTFQTLLGPFDETEPKQEYALIFFFISFMS